MGERSKTIGEHGEATVEKFLSMIGWVSYIKGITVPCSMQNGEHKNEQNKSVNTHGIDFLYSYINPLMDRQLNNIIISSKFSTKKYPNSPTSKFKWYVTDLFNTIKCFEISDKIKEIENNYCYEKEKNIGVLFWLNSQDDEDDLISKVSNAKLDILSSNTIYIIDNKRIRFILNLIKYILTLKDYDYLFYYPTTGLNLNPANRLDAGKILPVEYINSPIIPFRLVNKKNPNEIMFFVGINECFDKDTFIRLMGLAKDLTKSLTCKVVIGFKDYNEINHKEIIQTAKLTFQDDSYTKNIDVVNFEKIF